jgi:tripartite-type tricarboxylate transporter receptor subunit TctC
MQILRASLAVAALAVAGSAFAEYPDKPVTIVVPFAAGGPTDKVARDLAEAMRKPLGGQSIIIDNVGGAGGTLGARRSRARRTTATRSFCTTPASSTRRRSTARCPTRRSRTSSTSAWSTRCR